MRLCDSTGMLTYSLQGVLSAAFTVTAFSAQEGHVTSGGDQLSLKVPREYRFGNKP